MKPNEQQDVLIDDNAELLALEDLLCEAEEKNEEISEIVRTQANIQPRQCEVLSRTQNVSIDNDAELLALEGLLCEADKTNEKASETARTQENKAPRLREDSTFADAFSYDIELPTEKLIEAERIAATKQDELDSSDDEEVKNFLERKYNEYGCDINKRLKQQKNAAHDVKVTREVNMSLSKAVAHTSTPTKAAGSPSCHIKNPHNPVKRNSHMSTSFQSAPSTIGRQPATAPATTTTSTFTDPVFGLRLITPLISSTLLVERMNGKKAIPFAGIAFHTQRGDLSKDWVIAGAIVQKSPVRISKKGDPYSVWRISDLRGEIKMASVFLFGGAHKDLWKTPERMCVAVLNPSVFEKRAESGDVACLSITTSQKVMILGQSKDLGVCKSRKRNGDPCTSTVNLSECDTCIFHMKEEFTKMSRRSELQSANAGRGLNELRNKVLGKSEVFYGGQSFTAIPAKKSAKLILKDRDRMSSLSEYATSPFSSSINHTSKPKSAFANVPYAARDGPVSKLAANVEVGVKQRLKDLERLKTLHAESAQIADAYKEKIANSPAQTVSSPSASTSSVAVPDKFLNREFSFQTRTPQLSSENFCIEVNIGKKQAQFAKIKAQKVLQQSPIEKANPNSVRGSKEGKRRAIDELNEKFNSGVKRQKIEEEQREEDRKSRIQRIIDASSSHKNLIDMREQQEQDKYFSKLEKKEALEEKMLNTYKMPCKAVICQLCKYTAFSAAERCKVEKHPLKVIDAEKRFFQCKDCGNRTATVFRLPKISCKNCHGSQWIRTAMIRERKVCNGTEELSLRGNEEKFLGSLATAANLNLLVPDED